MAVVINLSKLFLDIINITYNWILYMQKMHGISEIRTKKARDEIRAHKKNIFLIFRKNHLKTITSRSPDLGSSPSDTFPALFLTHPASGISSEDSPLQ